MLKNLQNHIVLWAQAKTGLSGGFLISLAVAAGAALLTFVFLCVTGYAWLSIKLGEEKEKRGFIKLRRTEGLGSQPTRASGRSGTRWKGRGVVYV